MTEIYTQDMRRIEKPDLTRGYLKDTVRIVHHEAVEGVREVWHHKTVRTYPNGGRDVRRVIDVPGVQAREAWNEEVPIQIYVPYTQEELDAIEEAKSRPGVEERIEKLERTFEAMGAKMLAMTTQMSEIMQRTAKKEMQEEK